MRELAEVVRFDPLQVTFKVDRGRLPRVLARVLGTCEVLDLSAAELPIEDIIATVFLGRRPGAAAEVTR
jgi:hypothetical protein